MRLAVYYERVTGNQERMLASSYYETFLESKCEHYIITSTVNYLIVSALIDDENPLPLPTNNVASDGEHVVLPEGFTIAYSYKETNTQKTLFALFYNECYVCGTHSLLILDTLLTTAFNIKGLVKCV